MRKLLVLLVGLALGYGALRVTGLAGAATAPAPPATGPEQALVRAAAGLVDLDLRPIWDELPPARRDEAEAIVDLARSASRPEIWARGFACLERARDLLVTHRELLLASERLTAVAAARAGSTEAERRAAVEDTRARLEATLTTVLDSGLRDPGNLRYLDLRELAGGFLPAVEDELRDLDGHGDARLLPAAWRAELTRLADAPAPETPSTAPLVLALELEGPTPLGLDPTVRIVPFEGRWLEARLAAGLPDALAAVRAEVELWVAPDEGAGDPADELLGAFETSLDVLEAATTPAELDAALDGLTGRVAAQLLKRRLGRMFG